MNQSSLIQALTGNIPGQGANGNSGQGALAGSGSGSGTGTILFSSLLSQHMSGVALAFQNNQPGETSSSELPGNGSPDGASALLQVTAGAAADHSLLANSTFNPSQTSNPGLGGSVEGQVLFGLVDRAVTEAARAAENSPVLAAVLADDGSTVFAAGPNEQNIPAPFQGIATGSETGADTSEATGEAADTDVVAGIIIGQLPAQASATAAFASGLASGRESASTVNPTPVSEIDLAIAIAPDGENVAAAAKGLAGAPDAPVAPPTATTRGEAAPLEAPKAVKTEGDSQPRQQLVQKSSGNAQANFEGNAGGSDDLDGNGQKNDQQNGTRNTGRGTKGPGIGGGDFSNPGRGIKTTVDLSRAASGAVGTLPSAAHSPGQLQSHMTSFRAMDNSMALSAGLVLPFDASAPTNPATGTPTSLSAQSLATGIQALQAGTSVAGPAGSAASFAHRPNFIAHQVGLQITKAIADGQNEFTIRLNPPELGRVEVRLEFGADGGVKAALSAEKPETLNLLQRDAAALERALNDAGLKTNSGSLNFSLQQGETEAGQNSDTGAGSLSGAGEDAGEDYLPEVEIEITEQVIQQMVADGTVDIRV